MLIISMRQLILASQSPRRQAMLNELKIPFTVYAPKGEELKAPKKLGSQKAELIVRKIAEQKAIMSWQELFSDEVLQSDRNIERKNEEKIILTADTLVFLDGLVLGKPLDRKDASRMLKKLSNNMHEVCTGVCLYGDNHCESFAVKTKVHFSKLSKTLIEWYLDSGEPFDKAGSYGVQGLGSSFIKKIQGSYSNVVGLPLSETLEALEKWKLFPWA